MRDVEDRNFEDDVSKFVFGAESKMNIPAIEFCGSHGGIVLADADFCDGPCGRQVCRYFKRDANCSTLRYRSVIFRRHKFRVFVNS